MTLDITWNLPRAEWARLLALCPSATLFHTPQWCEAQASVLGGRTRAVHLVFDDGTWAVWPLTERPLAHGRLAFAISGDCGFYGGPVFPVVPQEGQLDLFCREVLRRWPSWDVVGNPFGMVRLPRAGRGLSTHVVSPFSVKRSRGCKARINKARREGVAWRSGSAEDFLPLYDQAASRRGDRLSWRRPDAYYREILELPEVRCFVATQAGEPVAAMILGIYGGAAHYISGAAGSRSLQLGASSLLLSEILLWSADRGIDLVDLGPSAGLAGVRQLKESFGAELVEFQSWSCRSPAHWVYDRVQDLAGALASS